MTDTPLKQIQAREAARKAGEKHTRLMWLLLLGGFFLVCFAPAFGQGLVRLLGLMAFAAGLVERIVLSIRGGRDSEGPV